MSKPLIIIGNGGHAGVLAEILLAQNQEIIGFTAPESERNAFGLNYLGPDAIIEKYQPSEVLLVMGLGMLGPFSLREKIYEQFVSKGYNFASVIHPTAIISSSASLGKGVQIMAGAIIQTKAMIADNTIINTGVIVDHDGQIGTHVHIAPGSQISGGVRIDKSTHIGTGTTIIQGIHIGEGCLVGAGSVVVKHISNHSKAFGVPAKEV